MSKLRVATKALLVMGILGAFIPSAVAERVVGRDGEISLPEDFRSTMAHLGSWYVPEGAASGFHDVYLTREAVGHFRRTGRFPDGAVLVKELRAASGADYTTGQDVQSATGTVKQWFVMVKDGSGRFPENPLWGDGWGWALFKPDDPTANLASDYRTDCLGCHLPARDTDLVYIDAYPTLAR
jgi:hypothetical protein